MCLLWSASKIRLLTAVKSEQNCGSDRNLGLRGSPQQTSHQARPWSGSHVSAGDKPKLLTRWGQKQKARGWLGCRNKCVVKDSVNRPKYLQPEKGTFPPRLESAGPPLITGRPACHHPKLSPEREFQFAFKFVFVFLFFYLCNIKLLQEMSGHIGCYSPQP